MIPKRSQESPVALSEEAPFRHKFSSVYDVLTAGEIDQEQLAQVLHDHCCRMRRRSPDMPWTPLMRSLSHGRKRRHWRIAVCLKMSASKRRRLVSSSHGRCA